MRNLIRNVNLILPDRIMRNAWLVTEDERITLSSLFPLCRKLLSSPEKEGSVSVQN